MTTIKRRSLSKYYDCIRVTNQNVGIA